MRNSEAITSESREVSNFVVTRKRAGFKAAAPWLLGTLEFPILALLMIWLLSSPVIFRWYYPTLGFSPNTADAVAVVNWISSDHRERTLNHSLSSGQLSPKELRHFSDVRRLFGRVPAMVMLLGLIAGIAIALVSSRAWVVATAQHRGLLVWGGLIIAGGILAGLDWKFFWSLVHYPFFGEQSWRFPSRSYSLQLFPRQFWMIMTAAVLLTPALLMGVLAKVLQRHKTPLPKVS